MSMTPAYPTPEHEAAAAAIVEHFAGRPGVDAVLLLNSCARGKATTDSCLDLLVLVPENAPIGGLEQEWADFRQTSEVVAALSRVGAFSDVHLDVLDGRFEVPRHPDDEYPDDFEIVLGNYLVYAAPLWERGDRLARLRRPWLPYYDEALRRERLAAVRWCCRHHLDHIPLYVERGLYFAAFDRLYTAFRCFFQALFIARRTYPIAYNKWIGEQVVDILGLPGLYARLPAL